MGRIDRENRTKRSYRIGIGQIAYILSTIALLLKRSIKVNCKEDTQNIEEDKIFEQNQYIIHSLPDKTILKTKKPKLMDYINSGPSFTLIKNILTRRRCLKKSLPIIEVEGNLTESI